NLVVPKINFQLLLGIRNEIRTWPPLLIQSANAVNCRFVRSHHQGLNLFIERVGDLYLRKVKDIIGRHISIQTQPKRLVLSCLNTSTSHNFSVLVLRTPTTCQRISRFMITSPALKRRVASTPNQFNTSLFVCSSKATRSYVIFGSFLCGLTGLR